MTFANINVLRRLAKAEHSGECACVWISAAEARELLRLIDAETEREKAIERQLEFIQNENPHGLPWKRDQ